METPPSAFDDDRIRSLERPHSKLLAQYAIRSLAGLFLAPVVFVPLYFKYHTLRYRIGEDGISASWGILFKREVHLTYKRIQDIHVSRSIVERYLGLGTVELQTAAGSSSAELSLEGMTEFAAIRDFLYRRMRGGESLPEVVAVGSTGRSGDAPAVGPSQDARGLLLSIRDELEAARKALEQRS